MPVTRWMLLLIVALAALPSTAAAQSGEDAGDAVVVDAVNTDRELTEFDSTAAFRLRLPDDATCPGDSANDDYRVQTFLVPADTELGTLTYRSRSPDGDDRYRALRYTDGEVSTQEMTNQNAGPGEPALVLEYRVPFTFAHYNENSIAPGRWKIGVACTPLPGWNVEKYWDAEIELEAAPDVEPGGLRIRTVATDGTLSEPATGDDLPLVPIALASAAVILVIVLVLQRAGSRPASAAPTKEHS